MWAGELTLPSADDSIGCSRLSRARELALVVLIRESQCRDWLSYAQIQGSELVHPKIYIICE